jgi:hypothetical protein
MRKPDIRRLPRVYQPRRLVSGLDEVVDQRCFGFALPNAFGVATCAFFHRRNSSKGAILAKSMAFAAVGEAGFSRVGLMQKLDWLLPLHIEHAWESNPSGQQRGG